MPKVIPNPDGVAVQPPDSVLIQIGLDCTLNYEFVMDEQYSPPQLFHWMHAGVVHALDVRLEQVVVRGLVPIPYDSCLTTVAQTWVPTELAGLLYSFVLAPKSPLYTKDRKSVV